jgi:hypothetical protein
MGNQQSCHANLFFLPYALGLARLLLSSSCPEVVELINYIYSCITKTFARENFSQQLRFDPGRLTSARPASLGTAGRHRRGLE